MWKTIDSAPKQSPIQVIVIDMLADLPRGIPAFYGKIPAYNDQYHWFVGHPEDWMPNSFYTFNDALNVLGIIVPTHWTEMPIPDQKMIDEYTMYECKGAA
jgi:hypothetical protein